jgi:Nuclease-related domain
MGPRAVQVFWGDEPQVQSESDFLAQLESDLVASDLKALVLVNFFAGKGSRQVDFLIVTDGHVCHVELKNYMDALEGSRNGPWQSRRADGTRHVIDRQNPYAQALACKMALSDDMSSAAGREPGIPRPPGGRRFFTQFDSVVCVFPRLADGSDVPSDYKVQTLGYREFFAFLASPGRHPGWSPLNWETFIRDLGLVNAAGQGTEAVLQTTAGALAAEYRQRFDAFHQSGLHELVPLPVLYDGADVPPARLPGVVEAAGHLQVIGPSGCGKSHLLRHSLLAMGEHVLPVIVDAGMYEGRLSVLIERSVARFTTGGTRALLRAAAINGQHVLLAVDGFNECPERFREALAGDMSAFCLQTGAWTIITTQVRVTLPPGLASAEAHSADLTDTDRRCAEEPGAQAMPVRCALTADLCWSSGGTVHPEDDRPIAFPGRLGVDNPSSDTARVTIKKISFNPTSQRSSHHRAGHRASARRQPPGRAPPGICPDGTGFRHPQASFHPIRAVELTPARGGLVLSARTGAIGGKGGAWA